MNHGSSRWEKSISKLKNKLIKLVSIKHLISIILLLRAWKQINAGIVGWVSDVCYMVSRNMIKLQLLMAGKRSKMPENLVMVVLFKKTELQIYL